jgi:hypothetical protein
MYSVQAVFDKAIHWIDAQNESTGSTNTADTKEYALRTPSIISLYLNVVYPYSDTYRNRGDGRRPYLEPVRSMTDELDLDARILREVLPYGLAAKLLSEENPKLANYFQQCYEEALATARYSRPAVIESIELPYGGIEYGEFSHW